MPLAKDFRLGISVIIFLCAFVRPNVLEYGVVVWDPYTTDGSRQLERVQSRFL